MMRVIGEADKHVRMPATVRIGSTVMDYIKYFAQTDWPKALSVTVNGTDEPLDYRLQTNDIVHVQFGDRPTWNPGLIHSFRTDPEGKSRAQKRLGSLYRYFEQHEPAKCIELRQQIIDEGIRQIEQHLPWNERPLLVGTSRCADIMDQYHPKKFQSEKSILFHIGMGFVDEPFVKQMAERLREPNRQVGVLTLSFKTDRAGLMEAASHAATIADLSYTRVRGVSRDATSPSIEFYIGPDDFENAKALIPRILENATCQQLGLASVTIRRRNTTVWFSQQDQ